jgi:CubicO group peptidase (beta-lactamase class C family)
VVDDLRSLIVGWPDPDRVALSVTDATHRRGSAGDTAAVSRVASISKVIVGLTALVAVEEGTIDLDEPAGPPGATVRHLLAHAAGYGFDGTAPISPVGKRRIYSNLGIEVFAEHLATRAEMPFEQYQHEAVIAPIGMGHTELRGSPATDVWSSVDDLELLARELMTPTLVATDTLDTAVTAQFPELAGVVPGLGTFDPNPWGLAIEIRGSKSPHWTAPGGSSRTFGHFGGSGTYLWVDPVASLATAVISGTAYGPWANEAWPVTNQAILDRYRS